MRGGNQNKTSMVKAMGPLHGSQSPGPMYRLNPPLIGPVLEDQDGNMKLHYCLCTATIN